MFWYHYVIGCFMPKHRTTIWVDLLQAKYNQMWVDCWHTHLQIFGIILPSSIQKCNKVKLWLPTTINLYSRLMCWTCLININMLTLWMVMNIYSTGSLQIFIFFVVVKTHWLSLMDDEYCFKTIYEEEIHNDNYETTPSLWVCYKIY